MRKIVAVLAKHGFQNVLEKARLGRFVLEKISNEDHIEKHTAPERLRMAFEELGPTFIKLGQLLATRTDLIPVEFATEFKKLHDSVTPLNFQDLEKELSGAYGNWRDVFLNINEKPLATGSIAQVHAAKLIDNTDVVIKIQRPGIIKTINDDLNVLYLIADLVENSSPEMKVFNPTMIVDEFFKTMQLETNFIIEANNILRFQKNFESDPSIKIPNIFLEHTTENILVMEMIKGISLSQPHALKQEGVDPLWVAKKGMKTFFKMVFQDRYFHGDLHAGNLFILPNNKIAFVDFGVVGRLSVKTRDSIANMFISLAQENYEGLAQEFASLSQNDEYVHVDPFARDLRDLIAPYFGLSFKNVNTGKLLLESAALAAKYKIQVPSELMLYFKSIVTVEGMGREIVKDFDILSQTIEISNEILKSKYDPQRVVKDIALLLKDSSSLMYELPKLIQYSLKRKNSLYQHSSIKFEEFDEIKRMFNSFSGLMFLAIIIASLIISGSLSLNQPTNYLVLNLPPVSAICFGSAILLSIVAFYNYIKK